MPFYYATSNLGKLREMQELLCVKLQQVEVDLDEIQTLDLRELLTHKAQQAYAKVRAPVFVEDTSLFFKAWNYLPGPFIKWFLKNMTLEALVKALSPFEDQRAEAVCCIGFADGQQVHFFEGRIQGRIVAPRGQEGFGWDVIFQPEGHSQTFAEMGIAEKQKISMRRHAAEAFNLFLKNSPYLTS